MLVVSLLPFFLFNYFPTTNYCFVFEHYSWLPWSNIELSNVLLEILKLRRNFSRNNVPNEPMTS